MHADALLMANNSQHCWMLAVASVITRCCMFFRVVHVGSCSAKFETPSNFLANNSQHFFCLLLKPFAQLFQHCWGHLRALQMVSKVLWLVSFPRCTAGPDIVESFFDRFHSTANTDATTPNILGPTMLGVVASVCL